MMALPTNQLQGSCCTSPPVTSSWSRGSKVKQFLPTFHPAGKKDRVIPLKCRSFSSVRTSHLLGPKVKVFKILAFKGSSQHDDSSGRANKSLNSHVKVFYLQHESEGSSVESSEVPNAVPAPYTAADERTTRLLAIQNLFKNWLMLLHTPSQTQPVEGAPEKPSSVETSENTVQKQETGENLKAVWCYFLNLDPTIKIPLLLFAPVYLGVNLVCGSEVSKELTPLWILGPLSTALYIKVSQVISSLYIFTVKNMVKVVKNIPAYCWLVYDCIFCGKLKEVLQTHIWQPADIKDPDQNEVLKVLQRWWMERYLDFVEYMWPRYCKTTRFLKRANVV